MIGDEKVEKSKVNKVILVSGKHYYALNHFRESTEQKNVAIIRIESLCPFPIQKLLREINKFKYVESKYKKYIFKYILNINKNYYFSSFYMESRRATKYGSMEFYQASF